MKDGRIVGIGGIFFKCENPDKTKNWYNEHLGIKTDDWGASFVSRKVNKPKENAYLQWSPFKDDSDYFGDRGQQFMVNYRVENIDKLIERLRSEGIKICKEIESYDYGKFAHIEDVNGLRMELWEPIDQEFDKMYKDISKLNVE